MANPEINQNTISGGSSAKPSPAQNTPAKAAPATKDQTNEIILSAKEHLDGLRPNIFIAV
jgi:hypothetical protein